LLTFWRPLIPQEVDLHTKRTGHSEFADKTMEAAKPIDLEAPPKPASEAMDVDVPATGEQQGEDFCFPPLFPCDMVYRDCQDY
jgi:hypothetical protein